MKTVSAECGRHKSPQIGGKNARQINYRNINRLIGWGARTRTWEWRNQNPQICSARNRQIMTGGT
jgi:hypothetical protein